jgi:membrane-anchored glycerophosphoryl diester phosphodiesterase (GDPDase)
LDTILIKKGSDLEELKNAIEYSYQSMTWVTYLVLIFGSAKTIQAFNKAYKDNETYEDMRKNEDKTGIVQFYYGIIISILCVVVFFLPYWVNYPA